MQKTVLVTGGNKGIGLAICKGLMEKGFTVFLGARDPARGEKACAGLRAGTKGTVTPITVDISDEASIIRAANLLAEKIPALTALVNNAGIAQDSGKSALIVDAKMVKDTFATNALGPLLVTRALVSLLEKTKGAQVINVSSTMGQLSDMKGGWAAYRMSKTALNAVTCVLADELAPKHIYVNSMHPGWIKTDMGGAEAPGTAEQGANTALWLAEGGAGTASGKFYSGRKVIAW